MGSSARAPVIWRGRPPLVVAATPSEDPQEAVAALAEVLAGEGLHLLLLFCASAVDPQPLARAVQAAFPGVITAGCAAAALVGPAGAQAVGFVALGLCRPGASAFAHLPEALPFDEVARSVAAIGAELPGPQVLITLSEGSGPAVERLLVALGAQPIPHIGAAAGGSGWVFAEGAPRAGGLVALRVAAQVPAQAGHAPAWEEGPERLIVTGVSEDGGRIVELDGWPVAQRMRELARGPAPLLGGHGGLGLQALAVREAGPLGLRLDRPAELGEVLVPLYPSARRLSEAALFAGAAAASEETAGALLLLAQPAPHPGTWPCAGAVVSAVHGGEGLQGWATSALRFGLGGPDV